MSMNDEVLETSYVNGYAYEKTTTTVLFCFIITLPTVIVVTCLLD